MVGPIKRNKGKDTTFSTYEDRDGAKTVYKNDAATSEEKKNIFDQTRKQGYSKEVASDSANMSVGISRSSELAVVKKRPPKSRLDDYKYLRKRSLEDSRQKSVEENPSASYPADKKFLKHTIKGKQ